MSSSLNSPPMRAPREALGAAMLEAARRDERVVVLCADLRESLRLDAFATEFPKRFIEVGVAEQNMMGIAAGLALSGKIPFVCGFAAFNPGRNWDQLRVAVCYAEANVKIVGAHAGLSVGPDGATHQALEDIAMLRAVPGLRIDAPADYHATYSTLLNAAEVPGPRYIRFGRDAVSDLTDTSAPYDSRKAQVLREGNDCTVVACGAMVQEALLAATRLEGENISVEVLSSPSIKPLDSKTIICSALKTERVVTVEDHQVIGGLGSAVTEVLSEACPVRILRIGMPNHFGESGSPEELYAKYGLNADSIASSIRTLLKQG